MNFVQGVQIDIMEDSRGNAYRPQAKYKNEFARFKKTDLCIFFAILVGLIGIETTPSHAQELLALARNFDRFHIRQSVLDNPAKLQRFTDHFMNNEMTALQVPGVAVVVVKDGEILLKQGYGYANLESALRVDPDRTLFRAGSVSKVFTTTALLQLADRDLLTVADQVNEHLKSFTVPTPFETPITIAHLLTHTSGFDQLQVGRYSETESLQRPLARILRENIPDVIFQPGTQIAYSNYGMALAGLLVEEISGVDFNTYMRKNIFELLCMNRSTFEHCEDEPNLAIGYRYAGGKFRPVPQDPFNLGPAGALITTASDMANFLLCNFQNGRFEETRILNPETITNMQTRQVGQHQALPGWCLGFYETFENGRRGIMHSGSPRGFSSLLYLLPEERLGIFMVYNSNDSSLRERYLSKFLDHFFPPYERSHSLWPPDAAENQSNQLTGTYRFKAYANRPIAHLNYLLGEPSEITIDKNEAGLTLNFPDRSVQLRTIERRLFKRVDGDTFLAFTENERGQITELHMNHDRPTTLQKLRWWETRATQSRFLGTFRLLFAALIVIFPFYVTYSQGKTRFMIIIAASLCFLNFVFLAGLPPLFSSGQLRFGIPDNLAVFLRIPLIATWITAGLALHLVTMWRRQNFGTSYLGAFTIVSLAYIPFLKYWNLLQIHF